MSADLDSLLVNVKGFDDEYVERLGLTLFKEIYLTDGESGIHKTHDGEDVYFRADQFDHAFFNVSQWKTSSIKDVIDRARVARIRWIKEFISGNVPNSACWILPISRQTYRRLYCSAPRGHAVWLIPRSNGGWKFKSAHPAEPNQIHNYTKEKGSKRIGRFF
jgi:hypothetical protein